MKCFDWKWGIIALVVLGACSKNDNDIQFQDEEGGKIIEDNGLHAMVTSLCSVDEDGNIIGYTYGTPESVDNNIYWGTSFSDAEKRIDGWLSSSRCRKTTTEEGEIQWQLLNEKNESEGIITLKKVNDDPMYAEMDIYTEVEVAKLPKSYRFCKITLDKAFSPFQIGQSVIVNITNKVYGGKSQEPRWHKDEHFAPGNYQYICVRDASTGVRGVLLRATQTLYESHSHSNATWRKLIGTGINEKAGRDIHDLMVSNRQMLQNSYNNIPHSGDFAPTRSVVNWGGYTNYYYDYKEKTYSGDKWTDGNWYWTSEAQGTFVLDSKIIAFKSPNDFRADFTWLSQAYYRFLPIIQALYFDENEVIIDQKGNNKGEMYFKVVN